MSYLSQKVFISTRFIDGTVVSTIIRGKTVCVSADVTNCIVPATISEAVNLIHYGEAYPPAEFDGCDHLMALEPRRGSLVDSSRI